MFKNLDLMNNSSKNLLQKTRNLCTYRIIAVFFTVVKKIETICMSKK